MPSHHPKQNKKKNGFYSKIFEHCLSGSYNSQDKSAWLRSWNTEKKCHDVKEACDSTSSEAPTPLKRKAAHLWGVTIRLKLDYNQPETKIDTVLLTLFPFVFNVILLCWWNVIGWNLHPVLILSQLCQLSATWHWNDAHCTFYNVVSNFSDTDSKLSLNMDAQCFPTLIVTSNGFIFFFIMFMTPEKKQQVFGLWWNV